MHVCMCAHSACSLHMQRSFTGILTSEHQEPEEGKGTMSLTRHSITTTTTHTDDPSLFFFIPSSASYDRMGADRRATRERPPGLSTLTLYRHHHHQHKQQQEQDEVVVLVRCKGCVVYRRGCTGVHCGWVFVCNYYHKKNCY